jgi:1-acyl-sn-glycerol-3-phosphate acyltransferase
MIAWRIAQLCVHLLEGLLTSALYFPFVDRYARDRRVQSWSRRLVGICGVRVEFIRNGQQEPASGALIVANHISWLDIFVINSVHPSRFVAKSDIRDWPLLGWLCAKAGTIFISRGRVRDVRRIFENLVESLRQGEHVAFFPEGTTAAQGTLLPFHPNLFEAAIDAKVPLQPFALRYLDGQGAYHLAADFIGEMTFVESMRAILGATPIKAELILLPVMPTIGTHRRELAVAAHALIRQALVR